jgi:DNA-binding response OmpR family regulator
MAQPRQVFERASLMRIVWNSACTDRALDSTASRTRRAILDAGGPRVIVAVHGIGYRLGLDGIGRG